MMTCPAVSLARMMEHDIGGKSHAQPSCDERQVRSPELRREAASHSASFAVECRLVDDADLKLSAGTTARIEESSPQRNQRSVSKSLDL